MACLLMNVAIFAAIAVASEEPTELHENVPVTGTLQPTSMHFFTYAVGDARSGMEVHVELPDNAGRVDLYLKCGANPGIRPGEFEIEQLGVDGKTNYMYVPNPACVDKKYHILLYGFAFCPQSYRYSVHANSNGTKVLFPLSIVETAIPQRAFHYYKIPLVRISNFAAVASITRASVAGANCVLYVRYNELPTVSAYSHRDNMRYRGYDACVRIAKPIDSTMYIGLKTLSAAASIKLQVILNGPSKCGFIESDSQSLFLELEPLSADEVNKLLLSA